MLLSSYSSRGEVLRLHSRRDLFEREEKESLLPLPENPYEYLERKLVKVTAASGEPV